jgi:RNA polymerase sigma-70 factor, ECF subfamily
LEKTGEFRALSSLKTYLYRIVINKSIDVRRQRARRSIVLDDLARRFSPDAGADTGAEDCVRRSLDKIPDRFRVPFVLAELDGMPYREIADTLRLSLNTVRTRIYRCREKLKKDLIKAGWTS